MFSTLAYVTHEDLCKCFKGDTLLAIKAPSGTQLEVPVPDVVSILPDKILVKMSKHKRKMCSTHVLAQHETT